MNRLSSTVRKIYASLIIGNLILLITIFLLVSYANYINMRPIVPTNTGQSISRLVHTLKTIPEKKWSKSLRHYSLPWSKITLSSSPVYEDNALLTFRHPTIFNLLKENPKLEVSIFIKENTWLNIVMNPPVPNNTLSYSTIFGLMLILFTMFLLLNYWAVRTLNHPFHTLIQSLSYSEKQESWSPIPITGNANQQLVFKKINTLQENLNTLLQNRTRAFTAISHDLRTPLTRLKLRAESVADAPVYEKIIQDINEMESMIHETLNYFMDINDERMQRVDLAALLRSLKDDASELGYEVSFESQVERLVYVAYVNLLKRALSNLINNALLYGNKARINLNLIGNNIEVSISDAGPGIEDSDLQNVFMPFYRGDASRSRSSGGTGLGLTIAKEIIQKHNGKVSLNNLMTGGLQVVVLLPNKIHH